jgi:hypothetical protein
VDPLALIHAYLFQVRRRLHLLYLVQDGGCFLAGLSLLLLVLLLVASGLAYPLMVRATAVGLLLIGALLFAGHVWIRFRRLAADRAVARQIGALRPALRSDLLSTVELGLELDRGEARFSGELYRALARQTWGRLSEQPARGMVPAARLRSTAVLLCATVLAWALTATTAGEVVKRGAARLFSQSEVDEGRTATGPVVGDLRLTYHYPKHTARPPRVVQSATGDIVAPKGTLVEVAATALIKVARASLRVSTRGQAPTRDPLLVKGLNLQGRLTVTGEGSYRFELHDPELRPVLEPLRHRIDVEPDAYPRAQLFGPPDDLEVTARHRLEIGYSVEDDFGLSAVDLVYQVAARRTERVQLWRPGPAERRRTVVGRFDWDLVLVELEPGARISYWIEAVDNDAVSGPKRGRSVSRRVRIYSAEEKHGRTLAQQEQLVEQGLRVLAERLLLFEKEPEISPPLRLEKSVAAHQQNSRLVDGLRDLRNQMRQDKLVPRAVLRTVNQMQQRLDELIQTEDGLLKALDSVKRKRAVAAKHLKGLGDHNVLVVEEMEKDVLLLAHLLDEQRLQGLAALSREMKESRQKLAELLDRYRRTRDEKLRGEMLRQIERMSRKLEETLQQIARLRASIPDEYLNREALKDLDLQDTLKQMGDLLRDGKLEKLEAQLAALDRKLKQMQSMLDGSLQQYRQTRMSERERAFAAVRDRLRALEDEQRKLAERTSQIVKRYRKRAARLMKNTINPFVRRELQKAETLRRRVNEIEQKDLGNYDQEQLDRLKQRVADLRGMLDQGDLEEALQMARRAGHGLQLLQDDLTDELDGQVAARRGRLQRALGRARTAGRIAQEIVSDLESIFPDPKSLLDHDDRKELGELQRQQQALRKQLQGMSGQMERGPGGSSPFVGPELMRGLKEAGQLMGKAQSALRGQQPQEALGAQEAAAEQLAAMQKQMEATRQPSGWGGSDGSGPRERIEIPGADSFQPPRAFREDILDAMKEKAPKQYRRQVKEYYEELVR